MEYMIVVKRYSNNNLMETVTAYMQEGWKPQGGVHMVIVDHVEIWMQAMVKYEDRSVQV